MNVKKMSQVSSVALALLTVFLLSNSALAVDLTVNFHVEWNGWAIPEDVHPFVQLLKENGDPITDLEMMDLNDEWTDWSYTFEDVISQAVTVRIFWTEGIWEWDPGSGATWELNWEGETECWVNAFD